MNEQAFERRIKREIFAEPHTVRVAPAPGWKEVLGREIQSVLGTFTLPGKYTPTLTFTEQDILLENLDFRNLIELPLRLQTAADIHWQLRSRHVGSFGELVQMVETMPWELFLPKEAAVSIKVESYRSKLFHEGKLKDLISDGLRAKRFQLKDSERSFRLFFEQQENRHSIYLSLSQQPLFHRGYKATRSHYAPLQEHLAAACIQWFWQLPQNLGWQPDQYFIPFVGSGTFLAETLIARGHVSVYNWRQEWTIPQLPSCPGASWDHILKRLDQSFRAAPAAPASILIEKDQGICQSLAQTMERLQTEGRQGLVLLAPEIRCTDALQETLPESAQRIFIPLNPPYGLRLEQGAQDTRPGAYYAELAQWLKTLGRHSVSVRGFILIPDDASLASFQSKLGISSIRDIHSFTQGGQHIRCVAFGIGS